MISSNSALVSPLPQVNVPVRCCQAAKTAENKSARYEAPFKVMRLSRRRCYAILHGMTASSL